MRQDRAIRWLLLIYTIPAEPSRKRAFIWRELKKAGAVYLRDGVCALPEQEATGPIVRSLAAKIDELGGQATLVVGAELEPPRSEAIVAAARMARAEEYREIAREAQAFLDHIGQETEHRDFTFAEMEGLEADVGKLRRWNEQVQARDYFGVEESAGVSDLLRQCEEALGAFEATAFHKDQAAR